MKGAYVWLLVLSLAGWVIVTIVERARIRRAALLLSEADDKMLGFAVFNRICANRKTQPNAAAWPEHERAVALAMETSAIIGNGGFSFLFGSDLEVDPTYMLSLHALDAIGADAAARAYRDALALFPNASIPTDLERRRHAVSQFDEDKLVAIDDRFLHAADELPGLVATYIRAHRAEFEAVFKGRQ